MHNELKFVGHDGKISDKDKSLQFGVLRRPSFLFEGLRLPMKLDLHNTSMAKSVAMLASMSFFIHAWSSPLEKSWP